MDGVANQKRDALRQWMYLHDLVEAALRRRLIPDRDLITAGSKKLHNGVVDARNVLIGPLDLRSRAAEEVTSRRLRRGHRCCHGASAPSNESRLSCGALKNNSFLN